MKVICIFILGLFMVGCSLDSNNDAIDVYICGGQSNATAQWYEQIKSKLPIDAVVIWDYHPGASISTWYKNERGQNYISDIDNIESSLPEIYNIKGFFWFQGEADGYYGTTDLYKERFLSLISSLKEDTNDNLFNIYMFIVAAKTIDLNNIRTVQKNIVNDYDYIYGLDTQQYDRPDGLHLSETSVINCVSDMFDVISETL